jgi:predicted nucleic acid-binding protein
MIFIDSNIWCYYFDQTAKEHKKIAKVIEQVINKEEITMNTPTLIEVSHYLIKNLGAIQGKKKINSLLSLPTNIDDLDYQNLLNSIDLLSQHTHTGIGGRDATILATMKKNNIKKLLTHDKAFTRIDDIEVIDPLN